MPDPRFPFLGVHFTRMIEGGVEAGPNAVLALRREGYTRTSFSARDSLEMFAYPGFWRMAAEVLAHGVGEWHRSFSKRAFVRALQRAGARDPRRRRAPRGAGVRAQALDPTGRLLDDFRIVEADRMVHVLNAPSPAATASITIGRGDRGDGDEVVRYLTSGPERAPRGAGRVYRGGFRFRIGMFNGDHHSPSKQEEVYA